MFNILSQDTTFGIMFKQLVFYLNISEKFK